MFKIVRFPEKIKPFFDSLNNQFHWNHFEYFRNLVLLIAFAWGRRTIANLYRWLERPLLFYLPIALVVGSASGLLAFLNHLEETGNRLAIDVKKDQYRAMGYESFFKPYEYKYLKPEHPSL